MDSHCIIYWTEVLLDTLKEFTFQNCLQDSKQRGQDYQKQ